MNLNNLFNNKRTWSPADEGTPGGDDVAPPVDAVQEPDVPAVQETEVPAEPSPQPEYSFIPEEFRGENGLNEKFQQHYEELAAENARFKDGLNAVPEDGNYEFAIPENMDFGELSLPEGFEVDLLTDDEQMQPLFGELSEIMKQHNMPAEAAGKLSGLIAKYEATKTSKLHAAARQDFERLGPNDATRNARLSQAKRMIEAKLPAEQAKALMGAATSYDGIRALETLFQPRGPGPTVPQIPAAQLEGMRPAERLKAINEMRGSK